MARFGNLGIFAGGLAGGVVTGMELRRRQSAEKRAQEEYDLKKQENERQRQAWRDLDALVDEFNPRAVSGGTAPGANAPNAPASMGPGARLASMGVRSVQEPQAPAPRRGDVVPMDDAAVGELAKKHGLNPEQTQQFKSQIGERMHTERIGLGLWRNPNLFKDPQFTNRAGQIFLKAGMGEKGVQWLERGAQAVEERGIEALRLLIGGDAQGAEAAFNAGGQIKVKPGSAREVGNGRWAVTFVNGREQTIDPRQMLRSYLNPGDFFRVELKEREIGAKEQQSKESAAYRERVTRETERHNLQTEATAEKNADLKLELARIRSERGANAATALERNVDFLVKNKIAKGPMDAFNKLRTAMEKPEEDAILSVAGNLMKGPGYYGKNGWDKAVRDATRMVRTVKGGQSEAPGAGSAAPGAAAGVRTYSAGGKTFTDADIESTARTYGITTDQVKQRLGIR